jgi:hypothetical protein
MANKAAKQALRTLEVANVNADITQLNPSPAISIEFLQDDSRLRIHDAEQICLHWSYISRCTLSPLPNFK